MTKRNLVPPDDIEIRDDVPIPRRISGPRRGPWDRHFSSLKPNQSFAVPVNGDSNKAMQSLRSAATTYKKYDPQFEFLMRTLIEDGKVVIRVWRTAPNNQGGSSGD